MTTPELIEHLERRVSSLGSALVAFSGGVDSSLVSAIAQRALGRRALAVTAVSPSLASGELDRAREVARAIGVGHDVITTQELERAGYRRNGYDRCYHCKVELYERLGALARRRGLAAVLSGANADDCGDWRPGLEAAARYRVVSPLVEARIGKAQVRELARELGVPSADKPAAPCLASRIPYGRPVDRSTLGRIDTAEANLKALGYKVLRVRHVGELARVELGSEYLAQAADPEARSAIVAAVRGAGYSRVEVSARPFRSGSLNPPFLARSKAPD